MKNLIQVKNLIRLDGCTSDGIKSTCSKNTLQVILSIISKRGCTLESIDIKTHFLQVHLIKREIFVKLPIDAQCD